MKLSISPATEADAASIAVLCTAAAERLTRDYGRGQWSSPTTEKSVLRDIQTSRVLVARGRSGIVGTLRLAAKKPWAIDTAHFVSVRRPLYLLDMAVAPGLQRRGVGRLLLEKAKEVAAAWPADAIRLDAYDALVGAAAFYERCGYREVARVTYRGTPLVYLELLLEEGR